MSTLISSYSKNEKGRDFICADVHGHFSLLEEQLKAVGFNSETDRLFSLGDLIDRGDESPAVLTWLSKPWFHAIQGNHERMLINAMNNGEPYMFQQWYMWGGDWAEDLSVEELEPFYSAFSRLPIAIEFETMDGKRVALVHAELPDECDWLQVKNELLQHDAKDVERVLLFSDMLWRKSQPLASMSEKANVHAVENIDHVFHGHTPVGSIFNIQNRTFMDLGSYQSGKIGLLNIEEYLVTI